jgi:Putative addiction module component
MIQETIPALAGLSDDQKLRLVWELWRDVSANPSISAGTASLLDARLAEYEAAPLNVKTTDEVTAGILARRIAATR